MNIMTKKNGVESVKVLLVEDDDDDYALLKNRLSEIQTIAYELEWAETFESGVESLSQQKHDVYLVDYHLGEHNGLEFVEEAVRMDCKAPVIVMTGQGGHEMDVAAIEAGATDYLPKGQITTGMLERSIRHSIEHKRAEAIVRTLNAELEQRVKERTAQLEVATRDLQRSNEILQMFDRNQQDFIEIAAHELRTPLTVMIGYIGMMKLNTVLKENESLSELLGGIETGTNRLYEVVNSMLDVRRIDSGTLKVLTEPVSLISILDDVIGHLQKEASETRTLSFQTDYEPDLPMINVDPALMRKALRHVIINAIKYTPDGGIIVVKARQIVLKNGDTNIEISVRDTGIGLDSVHHQLVFEKFYQVGPTALHSSSKMAFKGGGPGLGLAIARGIVQAHNGKIWIESPGFDNEALPGSIVYIQLPSELINI